jgi:hypothetical protein
VTPTLPKPARSTAKDGAWWRVYAGGGTVVELALFVASCGRG